MRFDNDLDNCLKTYLDTAYECWFCLYKSLQEMIKLALDNTNTLLVLTSHGRLKWLFISICKSLLFNNNSTILPMKFVGSLPVKINSPKQNN